METLADDIFYELFININILKIKLKIEKTQIIKNTSSVGIEIIKKKIMINNLDSGKKVIKDKIPYYQKSWSL